jgi:nucleotide-binding universal stress UspA family protein
MGHKKILVAVDGSDHANKVLETGIEYSKRLSAKLIIVHCHKKFPTILGEPYLNDAIASTLKEAETLVEPFIQSLKDAQVDFEERLLEEPAGTMISDVARIEECELIIMGSRGLTNLKGLLLGSVTNRVLHTSPCSVLVVK